MFTHPQFSTLTISGETLYLSLLGDSIACSETSKPLEAELPRADEAKWPQEKMSLFYKKDCTEIGQGCATEII